MKKRIRYFAYLWILILILSGCSSTEAYMDDPISLSGDMAYYAAMDSALRKTALDQKHIEISGTVSADGYTTLFVGDEKRDGICFSCTFPEHSKALEAIADGDHIRLHGVCTGIVGNFIYLEHCQLTEVFPTTAPTATPTTGSAVPPTTNQAVPVTTAPVVPPTTEQTVLPTTEHTIPPTTQPTTPPATTDPQTDMVWIPKSGKKYHAKESCSGMKDPTQVSKEEAENRGFEPCKRCYS